MAALLKQLAAVRSWRAESVMAFLGQYAAGLDTPAPFVANLAHLRQSAQALEVAQWVGTEKRAPPSDERREALKELAGHSELEKVVAGVYEFSGADKKEERWAQVIARPRARLILLGAPGQGKTYTTKMTVLHVLQETLAGIREFKLRLDDAPVALWVKASALVEARAQNLPEAIFAALRDEQNQTPVSALDARVENWLRGRLASPETLLLVDSLDEVAAVWSNTFRALSQLWEHFAGRLVITCRTVNWNERSPWVWQPGSYREVELVPFKPKQQKEFIGKFLPDAHHRQRLNELLNTNNAMRYAGRTPLLLTFICRGFLAGEVTAGTTYAGLYGLIIRNLMSGVWKDYRPSWQGNARLQAKYIDSLARVVWQLFPASPETNRFSSQAWEEAEFAAADKYGRRWTPPPADLLEELEQLGLLIRDGFEDIYPCYSLAHRSLLEYLAARGLSETPEWVERLYPHLWFEAGWVEVSKFVVGLVADATPLLERLAAEADDPCGWKPFLQTRVVGFAKNVSDDWRARMVAQMNARWEQRIGVRGARATTTMLGSLVIPAGQELVIGNSAGKVSAALLEALRQDADSDVRWRAAIELRALGMGGAEVTAAWLAALRHDADSKVRWRAAVALRELGLGDAEVIAAWLAALRHDADLWVRVDAARALRALGVGTREVTAALCTAVRHDEDTWVRVDAAEALRELGLGDAEVIAALLEALRHDADLWVRGRAAAALGKVAALCSHQLTSGPDSQPQQAAGPQHTLRLIMGGLQDASQQGLEAATETLWQLLWQLPPRMKAECLQELRAAARQL